MATSETYHEIPYIARVPWILVSHWISAFTLLTPCTIRFYFPGVLVGPYLDYASYTSLIDGSLFKSVESTKPMRRAIPDGRKRVAYRKMSTGLAFLGLFVALGPSYNFAIALTPWFAKQNLFYRYDEPPMLIVRLTQQTQQDCCFPMLWVHRAF